MDYFVKNWDKTAIRYDQENNIVECYQKKMKTSGYIDFFLESCNVESAACAVEAVDADWLISLPKVNGVIYMGYGDMFFDYLNSPKTSLPFIFNNVPANEIMENLGFAIEKFSNAGTKTHHFDDALEIDYHMKLYLKNKSAIVLSYLTDYDSGHYITVVKWDDTKEVFVCYDPWSKNQHCKNGGVLEEYPREFFIKRARPRLLEVWKK